MAAYRKLEDLIVYQKLCRLHIEIANLSHRWPSEEKYELGSQIRNKIEGVNRSRGEAAESGHHLYMAHLKGYGTPETYESYRLRYKECIRMLNGMERTLEKQLPKSDRRWPAVQEDLGEYGFPGFPAPSSTDPCPPEP